MELHAAFSIVPVGLGTDAPVHGPERAPVEIGSTVQPYASSIVNGRLTGRAPQRWRGTVIGWNRHGDAIVRDNVHGTTVHVPLADAVAVAAPLDGEAQ